ncbi:MAG TPA: pyridoxamine 5'-phosphate oxidase family protein [Pseudonocardia sp.]
MAEAEVAELLAEQRTVTLATIGPDGLPHLAAMWFAPDGPAGIDLLIWTYGTSQKVRNLERDPRASVMAEAGVAYSELRGVCLDCEVALVRDPEEVLRIGRLLWARNLAGDGASPLGAEVEAGLRAQAGKRVGVRLRSVRIRAWDHRKLVAPKR